MTGGRQGRIDEQGRIDDITDAARDFALCLEHCFLFKLTAISVSEHFTQSLYLVTFVTSLPSTGVGQTYVL